MSCNTCQVKFSFFTKDIGCPSCGFSYCSKCLKYKCDIPDVGRRKVCGRCYNKLNKVENSNMDDETIMDDAPMSNTNKEPLAPIDIAMKLASLENPVKPPIVIYKRTNHWDKLKIGLEPADQQIVDRLRKLKDEERNVPLLTVDEIRQRLALLKDQDPEASASNAINIHQVDTRTDQEKADDLIQEYLAQIDLPSISDLYDSKTNFDQSTKERINIYKETYDTTDDDNTELISKVSAMKIETPPNIEVEDEDEDEDDDNECVMCSQTASKSDLYRCAGCTGDLYCSSCFMSSHDESEMTDKHKAVRFIKEDKKDKLSSAKMSLIQKLLTSDDQKNNH
ncbi:hypothetical protein P5V15_010697 [Pogonomyrmex californicus]